MSRAGGRRRARGNSFGLPDRPGTKKEPGRTKCRESDPVMQSKHPVLVFSPLSPAAGARGERRNDPARLLGPGLEVPGWAAAWPGANRGVAKNINKRLDRGGEGGYLRCVNLSNAAVELGFHPSLAQADLSSLAGSLGERRASCRPGHSPDPACQASVVRGAMDPADRAIKGVRGLTAGGASRPCCAPCPGA